MIFANGTTGTIGCHLLKDVHALNKNLIDRGQELELQDFKLGGSNFIHLAGVVGAGLVNKNLDYSRQVNVMSAISLAKYCLDHDISRFIYVSSSHVYAPSMDNLNEKSEIGPISEYAKQKYEAELGIQEIFSKYPERLCVVRVFSILGWNMPDFTLGGAIERVIQNPTSGLIKESLSQRDFLTPYTIAQALLVIAQLPSAFGVLNLCSGEGMSVKDASKEMARKRGVFLEERNFELTSSQNPRIVGDNSKLKSLNANLDLKWLID